MSSRLSPLTTPHVLYMCVCIHTSTQSYSWMAILLSPLTTPHIIYICVCEYTHICTFLILHIQPCIPSYGTPRNLHVCVRIHIHPHIPIFWWQALSPLVWHPMSSACVCVYTDPYTRPHFVESIHTYKSRCRHSLHCMHACIHTYLRAHDIHAYIRACMHTCLDTYIRIYIVHIYIHEDEVHTWKYIYIPSFTKTHLRDCVCISETSVLV